MKRRFIAPLIMLSFAIPYSASAEKQSTTTATTKKASARWCMRTMACKQRVIRRHRQRLIDAITPYRGPDGTRWAIPWVIVACEGGNNWTIVNHEGSGAHGPYQLLKHGEPWPVRTFADRLAHHRIAARLWAASRTGPWVSSRSCWGSKFL